MTTMKLFSIIFGILAIIFCLIVCCCIYYAFNNDPKMSFGEVDPEILTKNMLIGFVAFLIFAGLFIYTLFQDMKNPLCTEGEIKK